MSQPTPAQQLQALQQEVIALRRELESLYIRFRQPKPLLPDPVKFDGKSYHFDTWLPAIRAKLRVDRGIFGPEPDTAMFYYVYDRLESQVQSQVLPQLARAEEDGIWSYESILGQLERALYNPHRHQEAEDRLHELVQGSDTVVAYVSKFERLLYEAKGHNWDDTRKIAALRHGLSSTIKNRLAQQLELPSTYPAYLKAVQKLATRSAGFTPQASGSAPNRVRFTSDSARQLPSSHDPMDTSVGHINSIDTTDSLPKPLRKSPDSQIKDSRQIGWTYKELGACLRCGSFSHWLSNCPETPPTTSQTKLQNSSVGVSGQKQVIVAYDSDSVEE
jgi:hypothetical protein